MNLYKYTALLIIPFLSSISLSDDTDIYISQDLNIDPPNVLFILDTSGSMNFDSVNNGSWYPRTNETRMDVLRNSLFSTLDKTKNVNIGLMRFSSNGNGGYLSKKIDFIDDVKGTIKSQVNSFDSYGGTPISETLYEAYQYYYGKYANYSINNSQYFTNTNSYYWDYGYNTYARQQNKIDSSSYNNSQKYTSPITDKCQSNNIILFTDGEASADTGRDSSIRSLISNAGLDNSLFQSSKGLSKNCSGNGQCAEELALYMKEKPHKITDENGKTVEARPIKTYTIGGFFADSSPTITYLENLAEAGGGEFKKANDAASLSDVLKDTFEKISADTVSYSAPALSINAFNSFEHSEHIYFSVFEPTTKARWNGNLKKYKIKNDGTIVDALSNPAIDGSTGLFKKTSRSFWSTETDGNFVTKGGASSTFQNNRSVYTYVHDINSPKFPEQNYSANSIIINNNKINSSNDKILNSSSHLDIQNTSINRANLLNWIAGEGHNYMADALHGSATILNYGSKLSDTSRKTSAVIFTGTNSGSLHAIDADTGSEIYSFIPQQLLKKQKTLFQNSDTTNKTYGLDGPISSWFHDYNNDDLIYNNTTIQASKAKEDVTRDLNAEEEFYQLYLGMRRGGHSYFNLDVTQRSEPKLAWQINGNDPSLTTTPGFEELGQTWSKMTLGQIMHNKKKTPVLFFTGGYDTYYDPKNDGATNPFTPSINSPNKEVINGNAIYIVHAKTGQLLWKATGRMDAPSVPDATITKISGMKDSFPSSVTTMDFDGDGLIDIFYSVDITGKIWRFSIHDVVDKTTNKLKETKILYHQFADLSYSSNPTGANKRYFYHSLDATKISTKYGSYIAVSLVSGANADPLNDNQVNYFYTLRDKILTTDIEDTKVKSSIKLIKPSNLIDITYYDATASNANASTYKKLVTADGLSMKLVHTAEKGLSTPLVLGSTVLFTTFTPKIGGASNVNEALCTDSPDLGTGRLYRLNLLTGGSILDKNGKALKRKEELGPTYIPTTPTVIFPPQDDDEPTPDCAGGPLIFVGTELIGESECVQSTQKLQWHEL